MAEITPPEPVTLFNDMSEQNVTALLGGKETTEREKKPSAVSQVGACLHSSEPHASFVGLCVCACAMSRKLQAIEWKSGILKVLGK